MVFIVFSLILHTRDLYDLSIQHSEFEYTPSFVLLNIFMYEEVSFHFEWKNDPFSISYKSNATVENSLNFCSSGKRLYIFFIIAGYDGLSCHLKEFTLLSPALQILCLGKLFRGYMQGIFSISPFKSLLFSAVYL